MKIVFSKVHPSSCVTTWGTASCSAKRKIGRLPCAMKCFAGQQNSMETGTENDELDTWPTSTARR